MNDTVWKQKSDDTWDTVMGGMRYVLRKTSTGWAVFIMGTFEGADPFFAQPLAEKATLEDAQLMAERHRRHQVRLQAELQQRRDRLAAITTVAG